MTVMDGWHPVALSASIEPGTSAGTHVDGREYVVWRDNGGVAHVWEDRCPHRGMKLSFGFVRGDHIACLYHGWQYDAGGRCRYIPAHPEIDVPATIRVSVFETVEWSGMIWMTERASPPPLAEADGLVVPVRSLYVDVGAEALVEAIGECPPAPLTGDGGTTVGRGGPTLVTVSAGDLRLLLGIQHVAGDRSALHAVFVAPPEGLAAATRAHLLAWAAMLRHHAETRAPEPAARRLPEAVS